MNIMSRLKTLSLHAAFITAFVFYEVGMLYAYTGTWAYFWDTTWHLLINLSLFYGNALIILPFAASLSSRKRIFIYSVLFICLEFGVFLSLKYALQMIYIFLNIDSTNPHRWRDALLLDTTWRFIQIMGFSFTYWFFVSRNKKQRQVDELERMRLKDLADQEAAQNQLIASENAFLKSQVNSHFLFNTLSFLHSSVQQLSSEAGETILYLSKIMRYSLETPYNGKVKLSEELEHIQNIIKIYRLRTKGRFYIDFRIDGEIENLQIIPLVLITLVENIFKYGDLKNPDHPATIILSIDNDMLRLHIANKKRIAPSSFSYGIGLENVRKRLAYAYGDQYALTESHTKNDYQLELIIKLTV